MNKALYNHLPKVLIDIVGSYNGKKYYRKSLDHSMKCIKQGYELLLRLDCDFSNVFIVSYDIFERKYMSLHGYEGKIKTTDTFFTFESLKEDLDNFFNCEFEDFHTTIPGWCDTRTPSAQVAHIDPKILKYFDDDLDGHDFKIKNYMTLINGKPKKMRRILEHQDTWSPTSSF